MRQARYVRFNRSCGKPQQIQIRGPASCIVAAVFDSFLLGSRQPRGGIRSGWRFGAAGVSAQLRVNAVIVCQQGEISSRRRLVAYAQITQVFNRSLDAHIHITDYSGGYLVTAGSWCSRSRA